MPGALALSAAAALGCAALHAATDALCRRRCAWYAGPAVHRAHLASTVVNLIVSVPLAAL